MTARAIWRSEQPSYEQPIWSSQRPATPPSFHLRTPDDRDLDAVTWTRATTKSVTDYQGNVWQALSGEVPWQGYRRVQNTKSNSENVNAHFPTKVRCTATADSIIEDSSASTTHYVDSTVSAIAGRPILYSFSAKAAGRGFLRVQTWNATDGTQFRDFDISSGSAPTALSGIQDEGDGWFRCWVWFNYTATASSSLDIYLAASLTSTTYTGDGVSGVLLKNLMLEFPRPGQYTPSEYVSNGVLSTPYHGAKVDGVRYFSTDDQGRLIDGTRGYDRDGSGAWVESSSVTPVATGLSIGSLQTNRITYSSDLTSGWTVRGGTALTRTAAYDAQVGVYTQLRNVGASGVDDIFASASGFTVASRIETAFMLRAVSTSGTVVLHDTVSGSWSINLALVSTTRFERIDRFHPAVTISGEHYSDGSGNGGLWFYASSGSLGFDVALITKVEAERVQSLIYSAGSATTKNADVPSFTSMPGYTSNNAGAVVMDFVPLAPTATAATYIAGPQVVYKASADAKLYQTDGTTASNFGDQVERTRTKIATNWQAGVGRYGYRDGVSKFAATAYDGAWESSTLTLAGPQRLRELSIYPSALTTAQLQALSA